MHIKKRTIIAVDERKVVQSGIEQANHKVAASIDSIELK